MKPVIPTEKFTERELMTHNWMGSEDGKLWYDCKILNVNEKFRTKERDSVPCVHVQWKGYTERQWIAYSKRSLRLHRGPNYRFGYLKNGAWCLIENSDDDDHSSTERGKKRKADQNHAAANDVKKNKKKGATAAAAKASKPAAAVVNSTKKKQVIVDVNDDGEVVVHKAKKGRPPKNPEPKNKPPASPAVKNGSETVHFLNDLSVVLKKIGEESTIWETNSKCSKHARDESCIRLQQYFTSVHKLLEQQRNI